MILYKIPGDETPYSGSTVETMFTVTLAKRGEAIPTGPSWEARFEEWLHQNSIQDHPAEDLP